MEAGAFLLLSAILHRKDLVLVLRKIFGASFRVNYLCFLLDALFVGPLLVTLAFLIQDSVATTQINRLGLSFFEALPTWATLLIAVAVGDLIGYFRHRLEHSTWLWPIHSMHHSDREMKLAYRLPYPPFESGSNGFD